MKYGYKELKENSKCKTCLGCNRLELLDFTGVYRCENYTEGRTKECQSTANKKELKEKEN